MTLTFTCPDLFGKRLFFLFFLIANLSFAQNFKIAALEKALQSSKEDTNKVTLLNDLARECLNIAANEKSRDYSNQSIQLGEKLAAKASDKNELLFLQKAKAKSYHGIGLNYAKQGNYTEAMNYYQKAMEIRNQLSDKKGIAFSLISFGNIYIYQGNYAQSLTYYLQALKIQEEINDRLNMGNTLINIGAIYYYQSNYQQTLVYYLQALKIYEEFGETESISQSLGNIGEVYRQLGKVDSALTFNFKALKTYEHLNDKQQIGMTLGNIGTVYFDQKKYKEALEYYLKSLVIQQEINDKDGMANCFMNIGEVYGIEGKMKEAIDYENKALAIAKEIGSKEKMKEAYKYLTAIYIKMGDYKRAYQHHQFYSEMKDSLFSEESSKQITEMQTKYDTEKKEQQILLLNKDKEIQTKDLERQKTIRNAVAGGLMLVLFFSFILINRLMLIRKQKKLIEVEREKSEKLLLNILPKEIAEELKQSHQTAGSGQMAVTPRKYEMVTVMFTDFKGFTTIAEKMSAEELVGELDFIFKKFDEIISKYPIEKIKTIGDAYMCAGGLPVANTTNPMDVLMAALEIQEFMKAQNKWQLRLGIHTGSVIAGVVGDKKFAYDIWGDAVNTASRMESSGEAGKVNISGDTYKNLSGFENPKGLQFQFRGKIPAKNKGEIEMYFVEKK